MAEPITGGLSVQREEAPTRTEPSMDALAQARLEYDRQRKALIEQQQRLVDSLESRVSQPADMLMSMAQGFLAPTRTGGFGESFGNVAGQMQKERAAEDARIQQLAKMRMELGQAQLSAAKENMLAQTVPAMLGAGASGAPEGAGGAPVSPTSLIPPGIRPILSTMAVLDPAKAISYVLDLAKDEAKRPDAIKALEAYIGMLPPEMRDAARQYVAKANIFGKPEDKTTAILAIEKAIDEERIPRPAGEQMIREIRGGAMPPAATAVAPVSAPAVTPPAAAQPPSITGKFEGTPQQVSAEIERIVDPKEREEARAAYSSQLSAQPAAAEQRPTFREREVEQARATERGKELEKLEVARREALQQNAEKARRIVNDANTVFDLASKNPNAYGILARPGIASALLTLVENGIRVGVYSIGLNDVQSAILRAGGTQQDIDAAAALAQVAVQTSLDLSAAVKGSVSNYEQQLFQQASYSKNDSAAVLKYKAELARARGEFDRFIWNKYRSYEKSNKGATVEGFKETEEYGKYVTQYENALKSIRGQYFR